MPLRRVSAKTAGVLLNGGGRPQYAAGHVIRAQLAVQLRGPGYRRPKWCRGHDDEPHQRDAAEAFGAVVCDERQSMCANGTERCGRTAHTGSVGARVRHSLW